MPRVADPRAGREAYRSFLLRSQELQTNTSAAVIASLYVRTLTNILDEGIFARPERPPAMPSNFVAVRDPTIALRLGARKRTRDSTYSNIRLRASSSSKHIFAAFSTEAHCCGLIWTPRVVVASTVTTITIAGGSVPCSLLARSSSSCRCRMFSLLLSMSRDRSLPVDCLLSVRLEYNHKGCRPVFQAQESAPSSCRARTVMERC